MSRRSVRPNLEALDGRVLLSGMPALAMTDATIIEGNAGTQYAAVTVTLSRPSAQTVTVSYGTADGTATAAGNDYIATSGKLSFAPGQSSKVILVPILGDRIGEADESFSIRLNGAKNASISRVGGAVSILDDEPRLRIGDAAISAGDGGTRLFTFNVSLSAACDQAVTVDFATQDGSALAGEDYVAASGTLTFAPGETTRTITVAVLGDTTPEPDEYFYVMLSNASTNVWSTAGAYVLVHNDAYPGEPYDGSFKDGDGFGIAP